MIEAFGAVILYLSVLIIAVTLVAGLLFINRGENEKEMSEKIDREGKDIVESIVSK